MEFSPRKSKSKEFCCVFGCSSTASKHETVRFFHFPKAGDSYIKIPNLFGESELLDRRKPWENVLKMGKPITNSMVVCSLHFRQEDFYFASRFKIIYSINISFLIIKVYIFFALRSTKLKFVHNFQIKFF